MHAHTSTFTCKPSWIPAKRRGHMHRLCGVLSSERLNSGLIKPLSAWSSVPSLSQTELYLTTLTFTCNLHLRMLFSFSLQDDAAYTLLFFCYQLVYTAVLSASVFFTDLSVKWTFTISSQYLNICVCPCLSWQEADGDDRLGFQGDAEGECDGDSKADTPDVPLSTADTDNTPQCLNKALEGLPPRYTLLKHWYSQEIAANRCFLFLKCILDLSLLRNML